MKLEVLFPHSKTFIVVFVLVMWINLATTDSMYAGTKLRHMNYVVLSNPPFDHFVRGPNGTFSYHGTSYEIVRWLAARYHFTYTIKPLNQTLEQKFGTNEAAHLQLINDEDIDGIVCSFYITLDRKNKLDYTTFPTWYEVFQIIVPIPGDESRLFAFIRPFEPTVWLFVLVSIIFVVSMMTLFSWFYQHYTRYTKKIHESSKRKDRLNNNAKKTNPVDQNRILSYITSHSIYVINVMTNQGGREGIGKFSFRILIGFFLVSAMVLVNSYSGIVISSLTVPKMKPSIETLEEWAASKEVEVLIRKDVLTGIQFLAATSGIYKVLADRARLDPEDRIVGDPVTLNTKLETGRYAYTFGGTFCRSFVANQYRKDKRCRFKVSKPLKSITPGYFYWPTKKGSGLSEIFNKGIIDMFELGGLVRVWAKDAVPRADECFTTGTKPRSARQKPIRLTDLTSAFLILSIGIGLATISFLMEYLFSNFRRHSKSFTVL